jgi:hypothetical protein
VFLFLVATITMAMGMFHYQQVAALAREGARYASVHGAQYAQDTGNAAADYSSIYNNAILPMAVGLDSSLIVFNSSSVSWPNGKRPTSVNSSASTPGTPLINTVSVTVAYNWTPGLSITGTIKLSSTAVMPITY